MAASRRLVIALLVIAAGMTLDQATKLLAGLLLSGTEPVQMLPGLVEFRYVENSGGFLGYLNIMPEPVRFHILTMGVGLLLSAVLVFLYRSTRLTLGQVVALALVIAGGASNLVDRLVNNGGVIDFLVLGSGALQTGVFNLADFFILTGSFSFGASLAARKS